MFWRRRRYILALLAFFGFAVSMVMRVNMALAIVDMTTNKTKVGDNTTYAEPEFEWDSREAGLVLSAFFYGYVATTLPGGWLAGRYGGKWVFGVGMLGTSLFTLLTPPLAPRGLDAVLALRVLVGVCESLFEQSLKKSHFRKSLRKSLRKVTSNSHFRKGVRCRNNFRLSSLFDLPNHKMAKKKAVPRLKQLTYGEVLMTEIVLERLKEAEEKSNTKKGPNQ
ncbi:uncharacterized protein GBIM_02337 [Gryllus bimaculatus]|nr:uncharacterized protein GBIM_02337 [Gryllus bimaculatus]